MRTEQAISFLRHPGEEPSSTGESTCKQREAQELRQPRLETHRSVPLSAEALALTAMGECDTLAPAQPFRYSEVGQRSLLG